MGKILQQITKANGNVKLTKVLKHVAISLTKAKKTDKSVIKAFSLYLTSEWKDLCDVVIAKADDVKATEASVNKFLKFCDKTMSEFGPNTEEEIAEYVEFLYKFYKIKFIDDNELTPTEKADVPTLDPSIWLAVDEEAIASITRIMNSSTGKFYQGSVQQTVHESVKKTMLEQGLTTTEAVEIMKKDLSKALKISKGKLASGVVPKGYVGTADSYFAGLVENTATLSRTSSSIYSIQEVGAKYVIIRSVRSSRTCSGCLAMDGTKYKIKDAVKQLEKILSINDVSEYASVQPSFHFHKADGASGTEKAEAKAIAESGATYIPPFHFKCECYTDMGW